MASSGFNSRLADRLQRELEKGDVKGPDEVLQASEYGLLRLGSLGLVEADWLTYHAATSLLKPGFMTALELETLNEKWRRLSSGCPVIDETIGGGFAVRGITEIAGESGCGKTQICLQLCLSVQFSLLEGGLEGGAVYICTEDSFPTKRLQQLFKTYPTQRNFLNKKDVPNFGDNIFIEHIADPDQLRQCVMGRLPKLLSRHPVKLIIIDSIAGAFRSSYEATEMRNRAEDMRTIGGHLHKIATQFSTCIICVNQVSASVGQQNCIPALGLAWSNLVTTRIQLFKQEPGGVDEAPLRYLSVVFAPDLPKAETYYTISEAGVFGKR